MHIFKLQDKTFYHLFPDFQSHIFINSSPSIIIDLLYQHMQPYPSLQQYVVQDINNLQLPPAAQQSTLLKAFPTQVIKMHKIRNHSSWQSLVKQTAEWVNTKIHVLRVISISVVLCHTTGAGQCTVYYNESDDPILKGQILDNLTMSLGVAVLDTFNTWQKQHEKLRDTLPQLAGMGGVIGVSELEVNQKHGRALSIIWYRKVY